MAWGSHLQKRASPETTELLCEAGTPDPVVRRLVVRQSRCNKYEPSDCLWPPANHMKAEPSVMQHHGLPK